MMTTETPRTRPNLWSTSGIATVAALPNSMHEWVRNDLAGKGATIRMMVRVFIPAFLVILIPFWFIPTTLVVHLSHDVADSHPVRLLLTRAQQGVAPSYAAQARSGPAAWSTQSPARKTRTSTRRISSAPDPVGAVRVHTTSS